MPEIGPKEVAAGILQSVQHYTHAVMVARRVSFKDGLKESIRLLDEIKKILEDDLKKEEAKP